MELDELDNREHSEYSACFSQKVLFGLSLVSQSKEKAALATQKLDGIEDASQCEGNGRSAT